MAIGDLLHSMSTLVLTCTRHVSRASRKLGLVLTGRKPPSVPSLLCLSPGRRRKKQLTTPPAAEERNRIIGAMAEDYDEDEDEDGVWRRTILLGERCQPLDFSGAIHYDSRGRRLPDPAPRRAARAARPPPLHIVLQSSQLKLPP
ncbi:uncharacterized protein LOC109722185 [Ananas comosus]|uniref:Uncharacterized protein LOC109722185 n=1 Tax=Ananas comosus TaxID=4615 RepID=A0A199VR46_ANACO|nr:uncharacterized protein LOC109722185 [Ananas comosus]OAY79667.1 hypothetical protein ACMD2_10809 [Ananas comosus]